MVIRIDLLLLLWLPVLQCFTVAPNLRPYGGVAVVVVSEPSSSSSLSLSSLSSSTRLFGGLERVSDEEATVPVPFVDKEKGSFIECYCDSIATVGGDQYTIGVPCDYAVALCYFDENDQLVPVELDEKMMDDVYPVAERIVEDEFGEELSLQRTPQTLTLMGELEEDDDDDDDDEDYNDDDEDDDDDDGIADEAVEVLLAFEHRGREFNLVRLMDPVLLVGKQDKDNEARRLLLTPEESDSVMPQLESMFLDSHTDLQK